MNDSIKYFKILGQDHPLNSTVVLLSIFYIIIVVEILIIAMFYMQIDNALVIAIFLCAIIFGWDLLDFKFNIRKDCRDFKICIDDIRAMNVYNSYFLGGLLIFFGLVVDQKVDIPKFSFVLLFFGFLCPCCALFFIPLKQPENDAPEAAFCPNCPLSTPVKKSKNDAPEANRSAKYLWLYTLILSQFTIILNVIGILSAILYKIQLF